MRLNRIFFHYEHPPFIPCLHPVDEVQSHNPQPLNTFCTEVMALHILFGTEEYFLKSAYKGSNQSR